MGKLTIIISGDNALKNDFDKLVKNEGYWTWNVNVYNRLAEIAKEMGWNGDRNRYYYKFIEDLYNLSEEYFNFPKNYYKHHLKNFREKEGVDLLVMHGCKQEHANEFRREDGVFGLYLTNAEPEYPSSDYDKVIFGGDNFKNDVIAVVNTLRNISK